MGCASSVKTTQPASSVGVIQPQSFIQETFTVTDRLGPSDHSRPPKGDLSLVADCEKADQETGELLCQSRAHFYQRVADPSPPDLNGSITVERISKSNERNLGQQQCDLKDVINSVSEDQGQTVSKVSVCIQGDVNDPTQSETAKTPGVGFHNLMLQCDGDLLMRHDDSSFSRVTDSSSSLPSDLCPPVIIDNGSGLIKAGLSGNHSPTYVFPSVVGRPKNSTLNVFGLSESCTYVGEEAQRKRSILHLIYPIQHGLIANWTEMEVLWRHTFENELRVDIQDHPIVLTEPPNNPQQNREKTTEILFETFQVPSLFLGIQAVLALHSTGKVTGTVIDSGSAVTHVVPVFEGHALENITQRVYLGGQDLTEYMMRSLTENNSWSFTSKGKDIQNLPALGHSVIERCSEETRNDMYANIVLAGGNSMFRNMEERLQQEMTNLAKPGTKVKVHAPPNRNYLSWKGAAILSGLSNFHQMCVTRQDFEEFGTTVLHRKLI
ncbi:actin-like isoform X2 [Scyliorhinus canicula]|uniref:actin-like isoform X2 n=1 Tax=Scyliorhinus canicula TaxID=7830 RepID=UPI0018F7CF6C|nr:actin-like isoform X2 [Scyliorhinus canicula]